MRPASGVWRPACIALLLVAGCAYYNTFYNALARFREGEKLVAAGSRGPAKERFESAIKKSATVIKNYPRSRWVDHALLVIGASYYYLGDNAQAIAKFENLQAVFPTSRFRDDARFFEARALVSDRQYARGIQILNRLAADSRKFREAATLELAMTSFVQEDYDDAARAFGEFIARHPRSPRQREARQKLAESYLQLGSYAQARAAYREHRRLARNDRDRLADDLRIAECYLLGGEPDSTLLVLRPLGDRYPDLSDKVNLVSGKALLALGRKADARATLARVRFGTDAAEAFFLIGRSYEQDTNFASSLAYYDTARQKDPNSIFATQAGQRRMLISRLSRGLEATTDTAQARFLLAEVYHVNLEQDSTALEHYRVVADSFPSHPLAPKALYAIAWVKAHSLKSPDSLLAYQEVIDRYPRTIYAQAARKVLGQPLLPDYLIEKPLPPKPESVTGTPPLPDTAGERLAREDSLARVGQLPEPMSPGPIGDERAERRRERRHERDRKTQSREPLAGERGLLEPHSGRPVTPLPVAPEPSPKVTPPAPEPEPPTPIPTPSSETLSSGARGLAPETLQAAGRRTPEGSGVQKSKAAVELGSLYFAFDQSSIPDKDTPVLATALGIMQRDVETRLVISGFCDPRGSDEYNYELGWRRAAAARDWVVAHGIAPARIAIQSYGKALAGSDPVQYWQDRRVEFRLVR